jgi:hypothetical protein
LFVGGSDGLALRKFLDASHNNIYVKILNYMRGQKPSQVSITIEFEETNQLEWSSSAEMIKRRKTISNDIEKHSVD